MIEDLIPFSFVYDGQPSAALLPNWEQRTAGDETVWREAQQDNMPVLVVS